MGTINKGTIAVIEGNTARVVPSDATAEPTAKLQIPWHLQGDTGALKKGTEVVYAAFDDATGLILGRFDGGWESYLPTLRTNTLTSTNVETTGDVTVNRISLKNHVHGAVMSGDSTTSGPVTEG